MEPAIRDGVWCSFQARAKAARLGNIILAQLHHVTDPETGQCFKGKKGDSWYDVKITLESILLAGADEGKLQMIAELVNVLGG